MASPTRYTAQQSMSGDLRIHAFHGGASVYWAQFHGVSALPFASATLAAARANGARRVDDLAQAGADYSVPESPELVADFVLQVAICGEATH